MECWDGQVLDSNASYPDFVKMVNIYFGLLKIQVKFLIN